MADRLVESITFQKRTQQRRKMALTLANQSSRPNKQAIGQAWNLIRREGDRLQMVEYPAKKYGGKRITRVVRPGVPPGYSFKTDFRIESQGRTPLWDQAKRLSGKRRKDSIISNAVGVPISVLYQGRRTAEFSRVVDPLQTPNKLI